MVAAVAPPACSFIPLRRDGSGAHAALDPGAAILLTRRMAIRPELVALPNLLTYGRIVAIPLIVLMAVPGIGWLRALAFVLYVAAAVTDWLDGYLARKWNQTSPLGRMLDPIADKLLVGALLLAFAWDHTFSALDLVPATLILMREIFISGLREFMGNAHVAVPVSRLAKWKTTVQLVALGCAFLEPLLPGIYWLSKLLLWLAALLTVWTGAQYFLSMWPHLSGEDRS